MNYDVLVDSSEAPIAPDRIATQPVNVTVTEGDNATFSVIATGSGTLVYQWFANGTAITALASLFGNPIVDRVVLQNWTAQGNSPIVNGPFGSWLTIIGLSWTSYFGDVHG